MKILVTGATGRIGSVTVKRLVERGDEVRAFAMQDDPFLSRLDGIDIEIVGGNLATGEGVSDACKNIDAVIHLGALMAWTVADHQRLFDINLQGTFHLLQTVFEQTPNLARFVLASTDASYPAAAPRYWPVDEHHPQVPNSFYGMTKQATEVIGEYYRRELGLPVARVRFCYTLAPDEIVQPENSHSGRTFFLNPKIANLRNKPGLSPKEEQTLEILQRLQPADGSERIVIPYGEDGSPWIYTLCHVDDLVDGILLVLEKQVAIGDVFNLGPTGPFAMDVAMKYLSEKTGIPTVEAQLPGPALVYTVNTSKARTVLGFSPKYDMFAIIDEAVESLEK
jgi:UDP-glucose 4-epimerase